MPLIGSRLSRLWWSVLVLLLAACAEEAALSPDPAQTDEASQDEVPHTEGLVQISQEAWDNTGITTALAEWRMIRESIPVTGVIAPDPGLVARISPLTGGRVERVFVNVGDRVRQGDPLFEYDNIELEEVVGEFLSALAELEKRRSQLAMAGKFLERADELLKVEGISRREYDLRSVSFRDAVAEVEMTTARLGQIHGQLHRFGLGDEEIAELRQQGVERLQFPGGAASYHHHPNSRTTLKAPLTGVVLERRATEGETVESGQEVLTLVDTSRVWVMLNVYEKDLSRIETGQKVIVRVAAYPDEAFLGTLARVGEVLDPKTRTIQAVCVVENPDRKLKLQMFTTVAIETDAERRILAVPSDSVQTDRSEQFVFVREEGLRLRKRVVSVGVEDGGYSEITAGLDPGEEVIVKGAFYVKAEEVRESLGEDHH